MEFALVDIFGYYYSPTYTNFVLQDFFQVPKSELFGDPLCFKNCKNFSAFLRLSSLSKKLGPQLNLDVSIVIIIDWQD